MQKNSIFALPSRYYLLLGNLNFGLPKVVII